MKPREIARPGESEMWVRWMQKPQGFDPHSCFTKICDPFLHHQEKREDSWFLVDFPDLENDQQIWDILNISLLEKGKSCFLFKAPWFNPGMVKSSTKHLIFNVRKKLFWHIWWEWMEETRFHQNTHCSCRIEIAFGRHSRTRRNGYFMVWLLPLKGRPLTTFFTVRFIILYTFVACFPNISQCGLYWLSLFYHATWCQKRLRTATFGLSFTLNREIRISSGFTIWKMQKNNRQTVLIQVVLCW